MLSSENPPPPPPPPQLHEKKAKYLEVDLLNYSDDISQTHPNKFSIRGYVFTTRAKDIKTHWPFSSENLQLCLKNGVKNVLPPFETLESVRNPSLNVKWADENTNNSLSGLLSSKNASSKQLASEDWSENYKSNSPEHEEDRECYSDVNPVPLQTKSPNPELKKPEDATLSAGKAKINIIAQNPGKKCRLIVKLGNNNISEPKSKELVFSEVMASSKVCPVCKTFMSSSNTTLNAHIDQCLSGESNVKRTEKPKKMMIKHRITKPRKTRLMVDIYETALCCTLEDLDRRNGTSWASNLGSPALDQEKNKYKNSPSSSEDKKEESAVYIDSNGTKVRILSKLSDMNPNPNVGSRKLLERDKVRKKIPSKKKDYLVHRENILKCPPYEQRRCTRGSDRCPEEVKFPTEENEKDDSVQPLKAFQEHEHDKKSNGSGLIIQWTGSKRTTFHQEKKAPRCKSHHPDNIITMKNSRIKSRHRLSLDDYKLIKRTRDSRLPTSSSDNINPYNPLSASDSHKRMESMEQQLCQTNRAGYSLFDSRDSYDDKEKTNNHMILISESNLTRKNENRTSFPNSKEFKKASPLSKSLMSIRPVPVLESNKCLGSRNRLEFKKSSTIYMHNNKVEPRVEKDLGSSSFDHRERVLKIRKKRWGFLNTTYLTHSNASSESNSHGHTTSPTHSNASSESDSHGHTTSPTHLNASSESDSRGHTTSPTHSNASSESDSHGLEQNIGSFVGDSCIPGGMSDSLISVEIRDEFVREPMSKISGGESLNAYGKPSVDEQEMLCAGKDLVAQVNVNEAEEDNYFVDVDPIPIPGPPGSFLPSPGRMGPEELEGNSSLTFGKLHSSGDKRELNDHIDTLDSPISGVSFVSNSIAFRSHDVPRMVESSIRTGPKTDSSRVKSVFLDSSFPISGDCKSPSTSTPNPVLRLMGKNLMVANEDNVRASHIGPDSVEFSTANEFSNGRSHTGDDAISFSRGPFMHDSAQHFDLSSNFRTDPPLWAPHHYQSRATLLGMTSSSEGFGASLDFPTLAIRHDIGKAHNPPVTRLCRTSDSRGGGRQGIVGIDDSSANPAGLGGFRPRYAAAGGLGMRSRCYDPRHASPYFSSYQTWCNNIPICSGSHVGHQHASSYHSPPCNGVNGTPVTWSRTPEGPSASSGHGRSLFYFPTGFSLPTKFT